MRTWESTGAIRSASLMMMCLPPSWCGFLSLLGRIYVFIPSQRANTSYKVDKDANKVVGGGRSERKEGCPGSLTVPHSPTCTFTSSTLLVPYLVIRTGCIRMPLQSCRSSTTTLSSLRASETSCTIFYDSPCHKANGPTRILQDPHKAKFNSVTIPCPIFSSHHLGVVWTRTRMDGKTNRPGRPLYSYEFKKNKASSPSRSPKRWGIPALKNIRLT